MNAVAPGYISTKLTEKLSFNTYDIPVKHLDTPEEVADAVEFLCGDRSSYITGVTLDVNGGVYMRLAFFKICKLIFSVYLPSALRPALIISQFIGAHMRSAASQYKSAALKGGENRTAAAHTAYQPVETAIAVLFLKGFLTAIKRSTDTGIKSAPIAIITEIKMRAAPASFFSL